MDLGLKGKRAVVTGATRGIGRAIAGLLADEGCDVAVCARDPAAVAEMVAALAKRGVRAAGRALDVRDGAALKAWIADAGGELGGLDILVSNVSAMGGLAGDEGWRRYFETDLMGTVHAVEAAVPLLERSPAAAIVQIASVAAIEVGHDVFPDGYLQAYRAFKAALTNYVAEIARTLGPKGIRANTVTPGQIYFPRRRLAPARAGRRPHAREGPGPHPGGAFRPARGRGARGRIPGKSGRELHQRRKSGRGWRLHAARQLSETTTPRGRRS